MQKLLAKIAMAAMLGSMLFIAPARTQAVTVPLWDVTGSYVFSFEYGGSYLHDVTLTQDGLGNLTGSGGHPAGGPHVYTWVLTSGSVSGNAIIFTADYTASADAVTPQTTMTVVGTIAPNGTMSGTWSDNYQGSVRNGTWSTTNGVAVPLTHVVVTPVDLDNTSSNPAVVMVNGLNKWFIYNDTTDQIDNTLGSFVVGPSTPFFGAGSIEFTLGANPLDRKNIATFQFSGTPLASIIDMSFGTYSNSGAGVSVNENPYLAFNVDFNGTGLWQRRLVYVPNLNGTVVQDSWQSWDAINGGNALWVYSGPTWPGPGAIPGTVPKTWNTIISEYPGIRLLPTGGWLGVRVGEPGPTGYIGNIDYFKFGTNAGVTTFDFDPVYVVPAPTNKDECKNDGWKVFTNQSFKNQGQCVAYTNHLE